MQIVHIDSGPRPRSYGTFSKAISGANCHPLQEEARRATVKLSGSTVSEIVWTSDSCQVAFSNGSSLQIRAHDFALEWDIRSPNSTKIAEPYPPVQVVWKSASTMEFDPDSQFSCIRNTQFLQLFVNDVGLLLYTAGNPILWFHAYRARQRGDDFLFAAFE